MRFWPPSMADSLAGRCILITRPASIANRLARLIRAEGGEPLLFPVIDVLPAENPSALAAVIGSLQDFDIAVFISPTAVERGMREVRRVREWPPGLRVAAVGAGTAAALRALGFGEILAPRGTGDSEALAALPELAEMAGRSVVIFRGQGGREWLRQTLAARGAQVAYAQCYRRARPSADPGPLLERLREGTIDCVSLTSAEGLENFVAMIGEEGASLLRVIPVFVPHPRIAEAARKRGLQRRIVVDAGDEALVKGIAAFFAKV